MRGIEVLVEGFWVPADDGVRVGDIIRTTAVRSCVSVVTDVYPDDKGGEILDVQPAGRRLDQEGGEG